jgi:transcriptional regulator with XRE-family HTH domain
VVDIQAVKWLNNLDKSRLKIAAKVRELRRHRKWTQADLAERLHLSQSRLSEIERGAGSFTAEQFLVVLKLFNVAPSQFTDQPPDANLAIQNALARLGALHVQESIDVLPSDALEDVHDVVREALLDGSPRIITALAPVLVRNAKRLNPPKLHAELASLGRAQRLAWVIDNTLDALAHLSRNTREWAKLYRHAELRLQLFLDIANALLDHRPPLDILDATIRSKRTLEEIQRGASKASRHWGIATSLQLEDFVQALEAARAAH